MQAPSYIARVVLLGVLFGGCAARKVERRQFDPETLRSPSVHSALRNSADSPYLKAHMKNGNLYLFESWRTDSIPSGVTGIATLYGPAREPVAQGAVAIGLDSVAILETNVLSTSGSAVAMNVFTGISAIVTVFCITNPKACFGSCPTFYTTEGGVAHLQAEGFSASIAPSLEAADVDALSHVTPLNGKISIEMKNEALETHVVRYVDLLVAPRRPGSRTYAGTDGRFWECDTVLAPVSAAGPEGDCLPALGCMDGVERFSTADSVDLATREEITLAFRDLTPGTYGLLVRCRQTLLPTYLLYQMLAYMGSEAGYWHAEIERGHVRHVGRELIQSVGGIEILHQRTPGRWEPAANLDEPGPLAPDIHLVPIAVDAAEDVTLRLRLTRGVWRIDYAGLARLSRPVTPIRLRPARVSHDEQPSSEARLLLLDDAQSLVTLPGDRFTLGYDLPHVADEYDYFLESRGYYLEWIRREWIAEENPYLLGQMLYAPNDALRRLAPEFKRVEASMEDCFWRSRYERR